MPRKRQPAGADTAQGLRLTYRRRMVALNASPTRPTTGPRGPRTPAVLEPSGLSPATYAALLTRYRPIEAQSKRWIAAHPAPATRLLRLQAYRAFLATAHRSWPLWPPSPYPPSFLPATDELAGFEAVAIATLFWAEWADQEGISGRLALTLLCEDLEAALGSARVAPGVAPRAPLWRPNAGRHLNRCRRARHQGRK